MHVSHDRHNPDTLMRGGIQMRKPTTCSIRLNVKYDGNNTGARHQLINASVVSAPHTLLHATRLIGHSIVSVRSSTDSRMHLLINCKYGPTCTLYILNATSLHEIGYTYFHTCPLHGGLYIHVGPT